MDFQVKDLRESNQFLNTLLDNITSAIFIVDRNIRLQSFNDSFQALFQKPDDKLLGELCGNAIGCSYTVREGKNCGVTSHCDQCELRASLLKAFSEKVPTYRSMLKREFFIGNEPLNKYFMFTTRYIDYRGDQMVLIIVDDVTELETQRLHLADLNQTKNRFLGIAAHDLRNPIAVIKGYVSLFLGGMLGEVSETQRDVLARMGRTGENMLNLINNLLDVSSIEAGRLDLATRPVALGDFLIECHAANELLARAKSIELKLSAEGGLPEVVMDPNRISQVINNLVTNAIKFSQPQTTIEIKARRLDGQVQVEVADQGPGIPEEELPKMFKEFGKTSVLPTAGEKSTGLGLAIVKRMVEAHDGQIGVRSRLGEGSVFYFTLPVGGPQAVAPANPL